MKDLIWNGINPREFCAQVNDLRFMNVTEDMIAFDLTEGKGVNEYGELEGPFIYLEPSGIVAKVYEKERICARKGNLEFYEQYFERDEKFATWLEELLREIPEMVVIGTEHQARVYPQMVYYTLPVNRAEKPPVDTRKKSGHKLLMFTSNTQ